MACDEIATSLLNFIKFPFRFENSDEKTDAVLQAKEELEHKNSQYEKLRREVSNSV